VCTGTPAHLGWGFRIRTDSVEGRIRVDSGGFPAAPQGERLRCISLYGHFDRTEMDSGFGQGQSRVGCGWIRVDSYTLELESADPTAHHDDTVRPCRHPW